MFKEYFLKWFDNKDKSLLIGQFSGTTLLIALFITVWIGEKEKTLGTSLLLAGVAMGWVTGILLSPYQMYNNEAAKFNRALQIVSTFISGAVAAKLLSSLTPGHIRDFFNDYDLLTRSLYFLSAYILTAILVYYDRVYPNLDEQNSFMTWCRDVSPGETIDIRSDNFDTHFTARIENSGAADLEILRADAYDPAAAHFISKANSFQTVNSSQLGLPGSTVFVKNPSNQSGKIKVNFLRQS